VKILFDHHNPIVLAHGGFAHQIKASYEALRLQGWEVDYLHWWKDKPVPDIIHYFGPCQAWYLRFARAKGIKTVVTQLHTGLGSRPQIFQRLQGLAIGLVKKFVPPVAVRLGWDSFALADALITVTHYEADLIRSVFHAPANRVHVVRNGVDEVFLNSPSLPRESWLICTAAITERKRVVELVQAATLAGIQLKVFGRPYSETDPYFLKFKHAVAQSGGLVEWGGEVTDRRQLALLYGRSRAFVLPSAMESQSLSALEAAACRCPVLVTDLPWARSTFGNSAQYLPNTLNPLKIAKSIVNAVKDIRPNPRHVPVSSWSSVAHDLGKIYALVEKT